MANLGSEINEWFNGIFYIDSKNHMTFDALVQESGINGEWASNVLAYFFISGKYKPCEPWYKVVDVCGL